MMKRIVGSQAGRFVLIGAVAALLVAVGLSGSVDLEAISRSLESQRNRWFVPVRLAVYGFAVWIMPLQAGLRGATLRRTRLILIGTAVVVELVAVQRLFVF